ncbi:MAG: hypothetical protein BMS9Abin33_0722 [Gammaproteobacteria bacterium]|nr:MAG: hypothetical protein BMS9Abin33_0722 [Gammaproteobacteria bacterium]
MLLICSHCEERQEVKKSIGNIEVLCQCGERLSVPAPPSDRQVISSQKQIQYPLCNHDFDPKTFRKDTEIACGCGKLLILPKNDTSKKSIGRRKTDQSSQLLEKELLGLIDTAGVIHSSIHHLDKLMTLIVQKTTEMLNVEACSAVMLDSEKNRLVFYALTGEKSSELTTFELAEDEGVVGRCITTKSTVVTNNVGDDPQFSQRADETTGFMTRSILSVPLLVDDGCVGALEILNKKNKDGFSNHDVLLAEGIASQVAIAIQNAQLAKAALKAERRAAIGEAVSGVAHCLNNMLNGLQGGLYVLKSDVKKASSHVSDRGFEMLDRNMKRLIDLAQDMLSCSKDRKPEYAQTDINEVAGAVVELMRQSAREQGSELHFTPDESLGEIAIDPKGIYRCILNLTSNALDACKEKSGAVVNVNTGTANINEIVIRIVDQGCGMDDVTLNSIFEPFFSNKGSDGTGLGLSVTRKIVEEHNGRIEVDSVINEGTTFGIYLPKQ